MRSSGISIKSKLDIESRKKIISFRYPPTGRYYIALTFASFREHVCQKIECISDCLIVHAPSIESALNVFSGCISILTGRK